MIDLVAPKPDKTKLHQNKVKTNYAIKSPQKPKGSSKNGSSNGRNPYLNTVECQSIQIERNGMVDYHSDISDVKCL